MESFASCGIDHELRVRLGAPATACADSTYDFSASSDGAPSLSQLRNVPDA
jgi:hypothetical protein